MGIMDITAFLVKILSSVFHLLTVFKACHLTVQWRVVVFGNPPLRQRGHIRVSRVLFGVRRIFCDRNGRIKTKPKE